ncbi:uncharacterized protein LOC117111989 [Anneissia japonica]|uniref:uncharacterized protein LOC117111989 n=1 Tax=Anneissia japonica TaxID=1529436 RepID=UPI001425A3B2|nr:uncharacterized protein LOC117111989 [Anneissia japonica]
MILQALTAIFGSAPGFVDIQILNLDPGSIIVDYYVELKSTGAAASDLDLLFVQNVNSEGKLNGSMLDLNPESIQKFYEICPEDYCNNGGTCSMDMNNFKSSCTCTEGYIGETCQLVIWSIIVGSLGVVFLLISLICCCYVGHSGRQLNLMYQQGMISKRPKYLEDNVYDKINLSPRFVHTYNDNNVTQGKFDGSLKENGHFSRPYVVSGN